MKKFLAILILTTLGLTITGPALAQENLEEPPTVEFFSAIESITRVVFTILLILAVIFLIVAGILFVTAGGSETQVNRARNMLLYALIGIVVALLARGIVLFLKTYIGGM